MKLIFDCRFLKIEHHDGISRFSSELFSAVARKTDVTALICNQEQLKWLPEGTKFLEANYPTDATKELFVSRTLNRAGATHVFSPMQTMGSLGRKYKLILTLHDLIYYKYPKAPNTLPIMIRIAWRLYHLNFWVARILLNRADAVATVSNTSRELIIANRLTNKPVYVVYNAPDPRTTFPTNSPETSPSLRKTLVYMGSFMEYKNVETLAASMERLPEFQLILLSAISDKARTSLLEVARGAANRLVFKNGVSDEQYSEILNSAFALVSASKDEGFGIPLVEAMTHSVPLVLSDIQIFHEIAGEAALFFDPSNPDDFASRVKELSEPETWNRLSKDSGARGKFFNWDNSAQKLLEALETL
ncbi:unannotated protein [freshwater metagenome]|uniref:Unannotated protein n=1 Tax=freshwater metagenome TaxID=449393 RepID=A0A6J6IW42_9ZZZZ|nr:glycosyltransferase [Actinomycetota bacterium]